MHKYFYFSFGCVLSVVFLALIAINIWMCAFLYRHSIFVSIESSWASNQLWRVMSFHNRYHRITTDRMTEHIYTDSCIFHITAYKRHHFVSPLLFFHRSVLILCNILFSTLCIVHPSNAFFMSKKGNKRIDRRKGRFVSKRIGKEIRYAHQVSYIIPHTFWKQHPICFFFLVKSSSLTLFGISTENSMFHYSC